MKNRKMSVNLTVECNANTRKRKRESKKYVTVNRPAFLSGFHNGALCSTPKISKKKSKVQNIAPKIGIVNPICPDIFLVNASPEVQTSLSKLQLPNESKNPYEVMRKVHRKNKVFTNLEQACFENPALNLELPDKRVNLCEVVRSTTSSEAVPLPASGKCFTNKAFNWLGRDDPSTHTYNPYEVQRPIINDLQNLQGVDNTYIKNLPFVRNIDCHNDFNNLALLGKKIYSQKDTKHFSHNDKCEDTSTFDIGKELDQYQLELENSINEAKLRKTCNIKNENPSKLISNYKLELIEKNKTFNQKLKASNIQQLIKLSKGKASVSEIGTVQQLGSYNIKYGSGLKVDKRLDRNVKKLMQNSIRKVIEPTKTAASKENRLTREGL